MTYPFGHHHTQHGSEPVRYDMIILITLMWIIFLGSMFLIWQKANP